MTRKLVVEFLGTFILVFIAVGTAVFGFAAAGTVGIALAFGLVLMAMVYAFGNISGCHVNPAVTVAMMASRRQEIGEGCQYIVAQFLGGIAAAGVLQYLVDQLTPAAKLGLGPAGIATADVLGSNSTDAIGTFPTILLEVVLTAIFVGVVVLVTTKVVTPGFAGIAIGVALTAVHLVGIGLDGTSVNPARSFGPALFAGGDSLSQVWVFILAPVIGGLVAAFLMPWLSADAEAEAEGAPATA
jgi:aquaporin Z